MRDYVSETKFLVEKRQENKSIAFRGLLENIKSTKREKGRGGSAELGGEWGELRGEGREEGAELS